MATKTFKANGNEVYKVVSAGTSGLSVDSYIRSAGVSVNSPFAELKMARQNDVVSTSLTASSNVYTIPASACSLNGFLKITLA